MPDPQPLIRDIADTARWAAVYRARETERPDALFRDPFARRLAGSRGEQIADSLRDSNKATWAWVARTVLFDRVLTDQIAQGVDMVVNLAAGLDARPYRMKLPPSLRWVEIDLPEPLAYKTEVLAGETPSCTLERIPLDLANVAARRQVVAELSTRARKALIITEGLLIYLSAEEVGALAEDLAQAPTFERWVMELGSPGLVQMLQKQWEKQLGQGGAALRFGPPEGPDFFVPHGWRPLEIHSVLKTAARLKRLSLWMKLLSFLPESSGKQGSRPWAAVCLFGKGS